MAITSTGRRYTIRVPGALALLLDEALRSGDYGKTVADVFLCGIRKVVLQYKEKEKDNETLAKAPNELPPDNSGNAAVGNKTGGKPKPNQGKGNLRVQPSPKRKPVQRRNKTPRKKA